MQIHNNLTDKVVDMRLHKKLGTMDEFKKGLLSEQTSKWPYTKFYWYFNLIDVKTGKVLSYILARKNRGIRINNIYYDTSDKKYLSLLMNVRKKTFTKKLVDIYFDENSISTSSFEFLFEKNGISMTIDNNKYFSEKIFPSTYHGKYPGGYEVYNLNTGNGNTYISAQYVIAKGPLLPWQWLHFYLEDGTFVKVSQIAGIINKHLRVNDHKLELKNIINNDKEIIFKSMNGNKYFNIFLQKDFVANITYKARFSPYWHYPQIGVHAKKVESNIKGVSQNQKGYGVLELASSFTL